MSGPRSLSEALYLTASQLRAESEAGIPMNPRRLRSLSAKLRDCALLARAMEGGDRRAAALRAIEAGPARGVVVDFPCARNWHSDAIHGGGSVS